MHSVDATQYDGVYAALEQFRFGPRNGKPTAIICHGTKGHGALSDFLNKHKVTVPDALFEQELALQARSARIASTSSTRSCAACRSDRRRGPADALRAIAPRCTSMSAVGRAATCPSAQPSARS